ncbi:MAG: flippase-like domain-containing protein [bacterium]|nr:MAG: flippase-like domain-containing protein [bacterium]
MKKKILWVLKLIVGIILLVFIYRNVYQHERFFSAFADAAWLNVVLGLILLIPNYFIQFIKWRYILRQALKDIPDSLVLRSLLFGSTLGFITPGNLGELARSLYFKGHSRLLITGLNIIDKLAGMLIFITFGLLAMNWLIYLNSGWSTMMNAALIMFDFVLLCCIWILALNPRMLQRIFQSREGKSGWRKNISELLSSLNYLNHSSILKLVWFNIIWFVVIVLQYHVLILAFTEVSYLQSFWAVSATLFTKIVLPISVGDLGIREGAAVFYYSLLGVKKTAAFNASMFIFLINFMIPAFAGSYFVFKLRWESNSKNKHLK